MIKADELRIGNLVGHHDADYANDKDDIHFVSIVAEIHGRTMVVSDSTFGLRASLNYQEAIPIPLTEEWLIKFGFEREEEDDVNGYEAYKSDHFYCFTIFINDAGKVCVHYMSAACSQNHPQFVHTLQNLVFALTGEELTIKEML